MPNPNGKSFHVIQNIPSPYRLHLFAAMAEEFGRREIDFCVHFLSRGHAERPDAWRNPVVPFRHCYWPDYGIKTFHFNPELIRYLFRARPDALLIGSTFDTVTSALSALLVPCEKKIAWSEGNTASPGQLNGLLGCYKRWIFKQCDAIAVPGKAGIEYVALHQARTRWRMPRPVLLPNLIDESRFNERTWWERLEIERIRQDLGARSPSDRICICPARLEKVKGLREFIDAVPKEVLNHWKVIILGQGSMRCELIRRIAQRGLGASVSLRDYVPYSEMPKYYAAADLFLLPSLYDPNPLSVVEALHTGLPLLLTTRAGNYHEALERGANGWPLDVDDMGAYVQSLRLAFSASDQERITMGSKSKEKASRFWSTCDTVTRFIDDLEFSE